VTDLRVRQALLHAIDREGLAEAATGGLASVAHMFISPPNAVFAAADRVVTKYPYDPARAAALLDEAGWRRAGPGAGLRDAGGQPLAMPLWVAASTGATTLAVVLDNWREVGIQTEGFVIPPRAEDELIASFPGAMVYNRPANPDSFAFTFKGIPTADNRWQGQNHGSLRDPEADRLQNLVLTLVDRQEWQGAVLDLQRHMSETLGAAPLHYQARVVMARNTLHGLQLNPEAQTMLWNIYEWELTS
jgi:peptide/nickel transport system substrate-binding protein